MRATADTPSLALVPPLDSRSGGGESEKKEHVMVNEIMAMPWGQIPTWVIAIGIITLLLMIGFAAALIWEFIREITDVKIFRKGGILIRRHLCQGNLS
jgi:hypothetical protein